jgi:hypothetical protein
MSPDPRLGNYWRHTVTVETIGPGEPDVKFPHFVDTERRWPPENVGSLPGFEMFLDAVTSPDHGDHDRLRDWYGGPYNSEDIDERFTRRAVVVIAIRRQAGRAAYGKSAAAVARRPTGHAY